MPIGLLFGGFLPQGILRTKTQKLVNNGLWFCSVTQSTLPLRPLEPGSALQSPEDEGTKPPPRLDGGERAGKKKIVSSKHRREEWGVKKWRKQLTPGTRHRPSGCADQLNQWEAAVADGKYEKEGTRIDGDELPCTPGEQCEKGRELEEFVQMVLCCVSHVFW